LPLNSIDNVSLEEQFSEGELDKIIRSTGIKQRRVANKTTTALTLGHCAANDLLNKTQTKTDNIGLVIFVTQTPDYPFPGNAVQLQSKLGLQKGCIAFDVNLGCSGFVYGLWQCAHLLNASSATQALLVVGDTTSHQYLADNTKVNTLFGDAASAILLSKNSNADPIIFDLGSDGSGAPYLIQPNGGALKPSEPANLSMDGTQVFAFTLREIPKSIQACLSAKQWQTANIDYAIMHQANSMMIKHLGDKLNLSEEQVLIAIENCGNTSSASIPLAMCMSIGKNLTQNTNNILVSGFGVGWSWGSAAFTQQAMQACYCIDYIEDTAHQ
jgi:3-oxoacyl-[acyl-carrier-protein] synthase-3